MELKNNIGPLSKAQAEKHKRAEWRIEVNNRNGNSTDFAYIPAEKHTPAKEAHWLIWIEATSIDSVPEMVERAKLQLSQLWA